MPSFEGDQPDNWLFRAEYYFNIHQLSDVEKVTVTAISFARVALQWYRWEEGRNPFTSWRVLKYRMLERFRPSQEGSLCARFLSIRQEKTVAEYRQQFEALVAPLPHLSEEVLESTFLNGLSPEIKSEVLCFEPLGLEALMKAAQRIEDKNNALSAKMGLGSNRLW